MLSSESVIFLVLSYCIGSLSFAVWVGKIFYKKDIREYGSGNAGATNTFRVLGKKAGSTVLFLDTFKGWVSVNLIYFLGDGFNPFLDSASPEQFEMQLSFGVAAVIGHLLPIYTGFRGGKGIATLLGFMIGVQPIPAIICLLIFLACFFIFRYVSLSSIIASISFPIVVISLQGYTQVHSSLLIFSIFVPILALITHQKNIERLIRGEENKAKFGKNK